MIEVMPRRTLVAAFLAVVVLRGASNEGSVRGQVTDASGAAVPGASVTIRNPISGLVRSTTTDAAGGYQILAVPMNVYHVEFRRDGFALREEDINIRSVVPVMLNVKLEVAGQATTVRVEEFGADVLESVPYAHYDVDQSAMARLPVTTPGSALSDAITLSTPGVVADSNGLFHPLGDHAQASFVIDGQPISDQQSKQFSTQLPLNAIQGMELITGGPSAEFGDKTSLVINAQTRSGLGADRNRGSFLAQYGSFGTVAEETTLGLGKARVGNFLAANAMRSGRFLDTPEFRPIHAAGNNLSLFDRLDIRPSDRSSVAINFFAARNWFQVPNSLDQLGQDQRQKAETFSFAPSYTRVLSPQAVFSVNGFTRTDWVNYYPSPNPEDDAEASLRSSRKLTNFGGRALVAINNGLHNLKLGGQGMNTRLSENFSLLRGEGEFRFAGNGNVRQIAGFAQDTSTLGSLSLTGGLRLENYQGLTSATMLQPRAGASYRVKKTGTVLRYSFSRSLETPYNENLLVSSSGDEQIQPGRRDQHNVGFQQALSRWVSIDADYFWKRTLNAYDFEALYNSPIFLPISLQKSKIDGFAIRIATAQWRGFQAHTVMGSSRARFFGPLNGGLEAEDEHGGHGHDHDGVFRIDHDQRFQQTTFLRYQYKNGPWMAFTWRYDSGMVTGAVPDADEIAELTGAQQAAIGLSCGALFATPSAPLTGCAQPFRATRVRIPDPGTFHPDHNPARIAPRHLFNVSAGSDNIFGRERLKTSLRVTVVNVANTQALYNFLSVFAGTHFVTPRAITAELGWRF